MLFNARGKSLFFFVHLPWNHKKIAYKNHKITKKSHTDNTKNQKSLKTYRKITRKNHLQALKSQKNHRKKSCDFKITKITHAILRSDLPFGSTIIPECKLVTITAFLPQTTSIRGEGALRTRENVKMLCCLITFV